MGGLKIRCRRRKPGLHLPTKTVLYMYRRGPKSVRIECRPHASTRARQRARKPVLHSTRCEECRNPSVVANGQGVREQEWHSVWDCCPPRTARCRRMDGHEHSDPGSARRPSPLVAILTACTYSPTSFLAARRAALISTRRSSRGCVRNIRYSNRRQAQCCRTRESDHTLRECIGELDQMDRPAGV